MEGGESRFEVLLLGIPAFVLILLNGCEALAAGLASGPVTYTADAMTAFIVSFVLAILLLFGLVVYSVVDDPAVRGLASTTLILSGSFSLWVGGGFLIGFVLAVVAGVIGVTFAYAPLPPDEPWAPARSSRDVQGSTAASLSATPPSAVPSDDSAEPTVVRYCPKCDSKNPATLRVCRRCGATLAAADASSSGRT